MNLRHSKEEPIQINTDEFKIEYPKRKSEDKDLNQVLSDAYESLVKSQKPLEHWLSEEELFDCYVRSDTE